MSKQQLTISDVKKIISLIHRKTALLLKIKEHDSDHPKQIEFDLLLRWVESSLKRYHDDDIENIERILMQGYTENEITSMFKNHFSKAKRKTLRRSI